MSLNIFDWDAVAYFGVWYAPLAACYFVWPILKRRRAYVVAAATLFLAPAIGTGFVAWPAFASVFQVLAARADAADKAWYLLVGCLPISAVYALVAWLIARRFVQPAVSAQTHKGVPERARARFQRALAAASPLRHMGRLLLLLVAVMAYSITSTFALNNLGKYL